MYILVSFKRMLPVGVIFHSKMVRHCAGDPIETFRISCGGKQKITLLWVSLWVRGLKIYCIYCIYPNIYREDGKFIHRKGKIEDGNKDHWGAIDCTFLRTLILYFSVQCLMANIKVTNMKNRAGKSANWGELPIIESPNLIFPVARPEPRYNKRTVIVLTPFILYLSENSKNYQKKSFLTFPNRWS